MDNNKLYNLSLGKKKQLLETELSGKQQDQHQLKKRLFETRGRVKLMAGQVDALKSQLALCQHQYESEYRSLQDTGAFLERGRRHIEVIRQLYDAKVNKDISEILIGNLDHTPTEKKWFISVCVIKVK